MGGGLATPFEGARKLTHEVTSCTVHALHGHMCAGIWHWVGWPFKMVAWTRSEPSVLCVAIGAGVVPRRRVPEGYCSAHWGMGQENDACCWHEPLGGVHQYPGGGVAEGGPAGLPVMAPVGS